MLGSIITTCIYVHIITQSIMPSMDSIAVIISISHTGICANASMYSGTTHVYVHVLHTTRTHTHTPYLCSVTCLAYVSLPCGLKAKCTTGTLIFIVHTLTRNCVLLLYNCRPYSLRLLSCMQFSCACVCVCGGGGGSRELAAWIPGWIVLFLVFIQGQRFDTMCAGPAYHIGPAHRGDTVQLLEYN